MSVGKTSDDGTISIFTKDVVTVHKEQDVLITCKGEPILISIHNSKGHYHIPLMQHLPKKEDKPSDKQTVSTTYLPLKSYQIDACCLWVPHQNHAG